MDIEYLPYWTEFQLRCCFSVKIKVVTYPYRLNAHALKVLKYYESVGFLDIIYGFYLPEEGEYCVVCVSSNLHQEEVYNNM
jgi:hypothetical protein